MKLLLIALTLMSVHTQALANNKVIIGTDNRYPITEKNRTRTHDSIGLLLMITREGNAAQCTGTIISKRHILTAAHCLLEANQRDYLDGGYFMPGVNQDLRKNSNTPKGVFKVIRAEVYPAYFNSTKALYDVGIIEVNRDMPFRPLEMSEFRNDKEVILTGYPGDKTYGTQWEGHGGINRVLKNGHSIDTKSGQSGSAIRNKSNKIIGVHSGGADLVLVQWNLMAPLTRDIINFLKAEMK